MNDGQPQKHCLICKRGHGYDFEFKQTKMEWCESRQKWRRSNLHQNYIDELRKNKIEHINVEAEPRALLGCMKNWGIAELTG